jgi:hypothetical protein
MLTGLACQTEVTADARDLYAAGVSACEDCEQEVLLRGAPVAMSVSEADDERGPAFTSLVQAALGQRPRAEARAIAPAEHARNRGRR